MKRGFTLIEMVLAITLFSMVAVGAAAALSALADAVTQARLEAHVRQHLATELNLIRGQQLNVGSSKSEPDELGVIYERNIEPLELKNLDDEPLANLHRITVRAVWPKDMKREPVTAEVFFYNTGQ
jgi:prepilin-type N-terminal cleavage/methylation domain-containing protein